VCQREGRKITPSVDGDVTISHIDDRPIAKPGFDRIGLSVYAPGRFDAVRIYTKNDGKAIPSAHQGAHKALSFEVNGVEIPDTLFEELLGDKPTPGVFPPYATKYDGRSNTRGAISIEQHRFAAKRFGSRFVLSEQLDEAAEYGLIPYGPRDDPAYKQRGMVT